MAALLIFLVFLGAVALSVPIGAAMILGGMKVTVNAHVPEAIIADSNILAGAPMEMILAGYGDIIGKYSCLADWKLSAIVNGEYICRSEDIREIAFYKTGVTL